jgi:hypothetical protein
MSLKAPCLNCPDRTINCHSICKLYIAYKNENDKIREKKRKLNQFTQDWYGLKEQVFKKINKGR